jgi:hypothetical protein
MNRFFAIRNAWFVYPTPSENISEGGRPADRQRRNAAMWHSENKPISSSRQGS